MRTPLISSMRGRSTASFVGVVSDWRETPRIFAASVLLISSPDTLRV